ncbi:MAG: hypothetical protein AAFR44_05275, partial [Pseudomonadota bacterium]
MGESFQKCANRWSDLPPGWKQQRVVFQGDRPATWLHGNRSHSALDWQGNPVTENHQVDRLA